MSGGGSLGVVTGRLERGVAQLDVGVERCALVAAGDRGEVVEGLNGGSAWCAVVEALAIPGCCKDELVALRV